MPSRYGGLDFPALASVFKLPCLCWQPSVEELVHSISHCWDRFIHLGTFSFFLFSSCPFAQSQISHPFFTADRSQVFEVSKLGFSLPVLFFLQKHLQLKWNHGEPVRLFLSATAQAGSDFRCLNLPGLEVQSVISGFIAISVVFLLLKGINNLSSFLIHGNYLQFTGMRRSLTCSSSLPKKI